MDEGMTEITETVMTKKQKPEEREPEERDEDNGNEEIEEQPKREAKKPAPPEYGPRLYKPSPELALIVGAREISRGAAARKVWDYIKREGLREKDDPSMFETNKVLCEALETKQGALTTVDLTTRIRQVLRDERARPVDER
jgi:chromatin remodeling complex protein RSC6